VVKRSLLVLLISALFASATAVAAPKIPSAVPVPVISIEGVTEYRLANGLQILLYPDESSSTVTVNVTYRVGSRFESYGETGMAHLLEHLMFKGTPRHPHIDDDIQNHGAQVNATTAEDRTNFFETLPATAENLEWALKLEADRMIHSFIAQKDLDSEMTVVRNEFELYENNPTRILSERVLEMAYIWHNYGHPTIGARADIEHVPIERLQKFYHTYYQPDDATLIVTGKFDETKTLKLISRVYGAIPKPTRVLPQPYTEEPPQDGEREVTLRRTGGERVLIEAYHIPADAQGDSAALGLLAAMLSDRSSGRLYRELIETKLATQAAASPASAHDPGTLMFTVVLPKEGDLGAACKALDALVAGLTTHPFTDVELSRARTQQLNEYERIMTSSAEVASNLSENIAAGDWRLFFWDRDAMKKVTVADLTRASGTYLIASNKTTGTFVPEGQPLRAAIPQAPPLDAMLAGYTGEAAIAAGEHFDPTPKNIEARTMRGTIGGLKTAYLPKKTRGDRVSAVLTLHFGSAPSLQHSGEVGRFTAGLLMRGTETDTRQQLQDESTRLKATLNVQGAANGVTVSLETTRENLPQVLRLAGEVLQHPAFPDDQLEELKRETVSRIEASRTEPEPLALQAGRRYLSPYLQGDFRYVPTFDEQAAEVSKVTVADLKKFHQQFYGASQGEIALVGSFDPAAVTPVLQELFGAWQSASPYERATGVYEGKPGKSQTIETPDKANAFFFSASNLNLSEDDPSYPALDVGNAVLGGGFLNSRLATRIRQQDGLSYSVGSQLSVDSQDPVGQFLVFAICAPQNTVKVETDVKEEIARALSADFTPTEIAAAKSGLLEARKVAHASDGELAADLARHLYLGRDFTWDTAFEQRIESATPEEIEAALRRFVDPAHLATIRAGDFH
jgi:zinc protease